MPNDILDHLNSALTGRYTFEHELGAGGMATVYLAHDVKHDRKVAVKVLRPELAAVLGAERFLAEIKVTANLQHPHILPLFDSGRAVGRYGGTAVGESVEFLFYVMPFVDGESLRDRMDREKKLSVPDAVRVTEQVASALSYAHTLNVIHRDVKPENIMLAGGHAMVADFGIARAVNTAGTERLTETGLAIGTPSYMSPEQAFGETNLDGRSDVYALGCVVYEMVSGRVPFEGATPQALLAKHAVDTAQSLRTIDPDIPLYVERAVSRALAKEPTQRFNTPDDFASALTSETVVAQVGRRRLAVLPPANLTGDPEQAFLVMGLHEALISQLGQGNVAVLARTSVMQYQDTEKPIRDVCRELSVEVAVESSVFRSEDSVGIQARLIDGNTEEGLWSGSYDGQMTNLFSLYRDVSGSIAAEIHGTMKPPDTQEPEPAQVDPAAYELYMRGRIHQQNFTPQDLDRAMGYYEAALEIAPAYAEAYTGIALIWGSRLVLGLMSPSEAGPKWREYSERAVELDPNLAEAHGALAQDLTWFQFDWVPAEAAFKRAIDLNPHEPQARIFFSHFLAMLGRYEESDVQGKRALEIDPFNPFTQLLFGIQRGLTRRFQEAIDALAIMPPNPLASYQLGWDYHMLGKPEEGVRHFAQYLAMVGNAEAAEALAQAGDPKTASKNAAEILAERSRTTFVKPIVVVMLFAWAGDFDQAFEWLERAFEVRDHDLAYLGALAASDEFAADPRYKEMLQRMKLPVPR